MEVSLQLFYLLSLLVLLSIAGVEHVSGAGPCGASSADDDAMNLGPCAAAAQDKKFAELLPLG